MINHTCDRTESYDILSAVISGDQQVLSYQLFPGIQREFLLKAELPDIGLDDLLRTSVLKMCKGFHTVNRPSMDLQGHTNIR